jgi:hypothetical protein
VRAYWWRNSRPAPCGEPRHPEADRSRPFSGVRMVRIAVGLPSRVGVSGLSALRRIPG